MLIVKCNADYRQLCRVFGMFTETFARTTSRWREFEIALRKWAPTSAAKDRVRRAVLSLVGDKEVEYRQPLVTIIFSTEQSVRFYPSAHPRMLSVCAILSSESTRKFIYALISEHVDFAVEHGLNILPQVTQAADDERERAKSLVPWGAESLADKDLGDLVRQISTSRKRRA